MSYKGKRRQKPKQSIRIQCTDCGGVFTGKDEYEAEVKWSAHECPGAKKYEKMSLEELRKHIRGGRKI